MTHDSASEQEEFDRDLERKQPNLSDDLVIALVGKVSAGKSSLLNAIFQCTREGAKVPVGATAGTTKALQVVQLSDRVAVVDTPGLSDADVTRSKVAQDFLGRIDIALVVVTGAADASQQQHLEDLRRVKAKKIFVVLNKVDEFDDLETDALDEVLQQWREVLRVDRVFPCVTKGYDPRARVSSALDLRGVDELRGAIESFLESEGKGLLLQRLMENKQSYAMGIIATALFAVAGEALLPGAAVYITATQVAALMSLYYLYTGRVLAKSQALAILPPMMAEAVGMNLFLVIKSLLPPTGIADVAAAVVAMSVTLAMLLTVNAVLREGASLEETEKLRAVFRERRLAATTAIKDSTPGDWKNAEFWRELVRKLMYA